MSLQRNQILQSIIKARESGKKRNFEQTFDLVINLRELDMKRPENIYDYLFDQIPKCATCGKIGVWKKPEAYKKLEKQIKEMQADMEDHSNDA